MRIERLIVREIEMPLRTPFRTSTGVARIRRLLLVELEDAAGRCSWAECVAGAVPGYTAETVESAWATITGRLAPLIVGTESDTVSAVVADAAPDQPMAQAAVEMPCWDLAARHQGISLAALLGGTRKRVATGIALGLSAPGAAFEAAKAACEEGYSRIKVKIQPGADLPVVRAVREGIGGETMLTVDANGTYTLADADDLARLDRFDLAMIEQPLPASDWDGHASLAGRLRTAVCLDESISTTADVERMAALRAGRIINLKPGRVGGLTEALGIVERAIDLRIEVWCGGMLETGVGRAYNVALASLGAFTLPGDLSPSSRYWERDIVAPAWVMTDGHLPVPFDRPGLGVDVDVDLVDRLTTRRQEIRAAGPNE